MRCNWGQTDWTSELSQSTTAKYNSSKLVARVKVCTGKLRCVGSYCNCLEGSKAFDMVSKKAVNDAIYCKHFLVPYLKVSEIFSLLICT